MNYFKECDNEEQPPFNWDEIICSHLCLIKPWDNYEYWVGEYVEGASFLLLQSV